MKVITMRPTARAVLLATLLVPLALASAAAGATALEDKIAAAPMPHTALGKAATSVKVHFVRLNNNVDASKMIPALRASLLANHAACVAGRRKLGLPVSANQDIPAWAHGINTDTYWSANRQITYKRRYDAHLGDDCGLVEKESYTARLISSKGRCEMDLLARTAKGQCSEALHAAAPVIAGPLRNGGDDVQMARMEADPRMAATMAQVKAIAGNAGPTGETRQVLGIACDVWRVPHLPDARICLARGGSFTPSAAAGNPAQAGIVLDSVNPGVSEERAVQAQLDADLNPAIFAPLGPNP